MDNRKDGRARSGITFAMCGKRCDHDFQGEREFEDGTGSEQVCVKCGMGAMEASLWNDC